MTATIRLPVRSRVPVPPHRQAECSHHEQDAEEHEVVRDLVSLVLSDDALREIVEHPDELISILRAVVLTARHLGDAAQLRLVEVDELVGHFADAARASRADADGTAELIAEGRPTAELFPTAHEGH